MCPDFSCQGGFHECTPCWPLEIGCNKIPQVSECRSACEPRADGDGAAAIILAPEDDNPGTRLAHCFFGHIGTGRPLGFTLTTGGSDMSFVENGILEFEHDCTAAKTSGPVLFERGAAIAAELGVAVNSADYVIPHQANGHLAKLLGPFLGIESHHVFVNADHVGNTGSSAIWLALAELRTRLKPGAMALTLGAEAAKYMFGGFSY